MIDNFATHCNFAQEQAAITAPSCAEKGAPLIFLAERSGTSIVANWESCRITVWM